MNFIIKLTLLGQLSAVKSVKVKPVRQGDSLSGRIEVKVQVSWLTTSHSVCSSSLVTKTNSFRLLFEESSVNFWVCGLWSSSNHVCAVLFCFVSAFSEHGESTCSGRSLWRRGAHPHPPSPQRSWAALSAWTPSPTAAHPWVSCFFFYVLTWHSAESLDFGSKRNLGMWAGGLWQWGSTLLICYTGTHGESFVTSKWRHNS